MSHIVRPLSLVMIATFAFGCGRGNEAKKIKVVETPVVKAEPQQPIVLPSVLENTKPTPTQILGPVAPKEETIVETGPVPTTYKDVFAEGKKNLDVGQVEFAQGYFEKAAALKPDFLGPQMSLAKVHLAKNDPDAALPYAERALEIDEHSSAAWNTKGRVELARGKIDEAIAAFERATEENPDNSHAWNNLGYIYIQKEEFEDAKSALEAATSGTQVADYMWNNLGTAYERLNRLEDARAAYRRGAEAGSVRADSSLTRLQGVTRLAE